MKNFFAKPGYDPGCSRSHREVAKGSHCLVQRVKRLWQRDYAAFVKERKPVFENKNRPASIRSDTHRSVQGCRLIDEVKVVRYGLIKPPIGSLIFVFSWRYT